MLEHRLPHLAPSLAKYPMTDVKDVKTALHHASHNKSNIKQSAAREMKKGSFNLRKRHQNKDGNNRRNAGGGHKNKNCKRAALRVVCNIDGKASIPFCPVQKWRFAAAKSTGRKRTKTQRCEKSFGSWATQNERACAPRRAPPQSASTAFPHCMHSRLAVVPEKWNLFLRTTFRKASRIPSRGVTTRATTEATIVEAAALRAMAWPCRQRPVEPPSPGLEVGGVESRRCGEPASFLGSPARLRTPIFYFYFGGSLSVYECLILFSVLILSPSVKFTLYFTLPCYFLVQRLATQFLRQELHGQASCAQELHGQALC